MSNWNQFQQAHAQRYAEWFQAAQTWMLGGQGLAQELSPYLIFVHSSEYNPEKHLLPRMQDVRTFGGFPVQGGGSARGMYRGAEIWVLHQFMGCTATQLWLECLRNTRVRYIIGLAEMTAYDDAVRIGDIVLPTVAARGDLVTDIHVPPDVPATGDAELLDRLEDKLRPSGWDVHRRAIYSGMPGGTGAHNPIMREKVWRQIGIETDAHACQSCSAQASCLEYA